MPENKTARAGEAANGGPRPARGRTVARQHNGVGDEERGEGFPAVVPDVDDIGEELRRERAGASGGRVCAVLGA